MMGIDSLVCVTGATGYIGGRLLPLLEQRGTRVRCLTRRPESLEPHVSDSTEVVRADVFDRESLMGALQGASTAYYLVHSMGARGNFAQNDRQAAANFAEAAAESGVRRIIYLGGLGDPDRPLSEHLRSRQEVGKILRSSHAQVIEFRAAIIIGSGSLSFELIRSLVERLPVMICPKWVSTLTQPIAVEDVLGYLLAGLDWGRDQSKVFEIGGPDQVSYRDIMREYARQRGLKRWMISVPVLTPRLSSLWLGLVTPVYARIGRKLVEGLRNPTLVRDPAAWHEFHVGPRGLRGAIERALANEDRELAETRWSDALSSGGEPTQWGGTRFGSRIVDSRTAVVPVPARVAFAPVQRIGGQRGWYYANFLWRVRGLIDLLVGGVGMRRGRRDPVQLRVGDALDFWRVEAFEPPRRLRLAAEMKVPGRAWLEFEVSEREGGTTIRQTAVFDPVGLRGLAYWYALYPPHHFVFAGMLKGIVRSAKCDAAGDSMESSGR
ncbi:MAG: SDR family oxidoreductase [Pirellulaceae bacterium]